MAGPGSAAPGSESGPEAAERVSTGWSSSPAARYWAVPPLRSVEFNPRALADAAIAELYEKLG
ncbi:hypothetical protein, partial [Mycobacterium asiaticum]|uniref:hypothetical protein n=1 Tax=Mycobacterium asiaticum TaxID=1790 RepID=UPI001C12C75C